MKQTSYNRILEIISNEENTSKHLPAIRQMVVNFSKIFKGETQMAIKLRNAFCELQMRVLL